MAKSNLPIEVHDHFRKANMLHTYVQKDLGEATKHALETGQELLLAKAAIPHGGWEVECERLFDGSLRTAQFYMQFAKNMAALSKAQSSSLLFLEPTLESAAKAARDAARGNDTPRLKGPPQPKPELVEQVGAELESDPSDPPQLHSEGQIAPSTPISGESDASEDFDGEDWTKAAEVESKPTGNGKKPDKPPKKYDRSFWLKQWQQSIAPVVRLVDKIAREIGESKCESQKLIQDHLEICTTEMEEWLGDGK